LFKWEAVDTWLSDLAKVIQKICGMAGQGVSPEVD